MDTQADSARLALRRSLDSPPAGSQESFPTLSPDYQPRSVPESFHGLFRHMGHCDECPQRPCRTGIALARTWLAIEETRERVQWL